MRKLELFLFFPPVGYLYTIPIPATNKFLKGPLDLGEFMRWVGCWLYMVFWVGIPERREWWSVTLPVIHGGDPFRLKRFMSCHCFDEIIASLRYTNRKVQYEDGLFHMMKMEEEWEKNMADRFNPYWTNVIGKSIMGWYNFFPPGFMCVEQKLNNFGNEHYAIYCGLTSILWRAHIFEGKDRPKQMGPKLHLELGRTVGLMIQMCGPIFYTGKYVVMDSGFCVSNGIVALAMKGVYSSVIIKKRRCWL